MPANENQVLAYDLGGSKLACAVINDAGKILAEVREPVSLAHGPDGLIEQMVKHGKYFLQKFKGIQKAGIASAGPLHPQQGVLLNPTNLSTDGKKWGVFPISDKLGDALDLKVVLENDAAAAALAEHWLGKGKNYENMLLISLGTGLGIGIIVDKQLVSAGRHLHPEGGHIFLKYGDKSAPCGCGNHGCAEAYLSGVNFIQRLSKQWDEPQLTGEELIERGHNQETKVLNAFAEYSELMAAAIRSYAVLYTPELILFAGGFAKASDLFMEQTHKHLKHLLATRREGMDLLPKLEVSDFCDEIGLLGAAFVAFNR